MTPDLFAHQVVGVDALVKWDDPANGRKIGGVFMLADEMGAGKTKQVIEAAQVLHERDEVDRVVVVCPASVRPVWYDPELGELVKHLHTPAFVTEYHARLRQWGDKRGLRWIITNYDFIRDDSRRAILKQFCGKKTWLVLDESSAVKNYKAQQTKACLDLRKACSRVTLLNGTPIANNPGDLYSQARIMDSRILDCKTWFHFRSRYALLGGWMQKQIIGWQNLEDLQRRMAPYVLRRLKKDCIDLPDKLPPVALTVPLTERTWATYKQMRDEMVAWLSDESVSTAWHAVTKVMRLAQITSGFVGGVEVEPIDEVDNLGLDEVGEVVGVVKEEEDPLQSPTLTVQEVGQEKLTFFLKWLDERLEEDKSFKCLVWCRFRPELARLVSALQERGSVIVGEIRGGQKKEERAAALRLLDPRTAPDGPVIVCGTPASGSMGLNLASAHTVVYLSNDHSLKTRLQSEDRVHRPGQINHVSYYDVLATGPQGQQTIDHVIIKALRNKEALATWTTQAWVDALKRE